MPSSKTRGVLSGREAIDKVANFQPGKIEQKMPEQVEEFIKLQQSEAKPFRVSELVADHIRLSDIEKERINEKVELETLNRLKELEETAYKEAHRLGREEGHSAAFAEYGGQLKEYVERLASVARKMERMLPDMHAVNEGLLIRLVFEIAKRVVLKEVKEEKGLIVDILKAALEEVRTEGGIKILLSEEDHRYITEHKEKLANTFDHFSEFRFEAVEMVEPGGCIIETMFGIIDAQISERIQRVWESINQQIPQPTEVRQQ